MKDMLVKLYDLPEVCLELEELKKTIDFRRPLAAEKYIICDWVEKNFGKGWMSETEVSFSKTPISTFVAIKKNKIIGFCTYESAYLNLVALILEEEPEIVDKMNSLGTSRADNAKYKVLKKFC